MASAMAKLLLSQLNSRTSDHSPLVLCGNLASPHDIIDEFVGYYQRRLGGKRRNRFIDLRYLCPWAAHIITEAESSNLVAPITQEEIKASFFDIEEDRSLGPDSYSAGLYKAVWPIIEDGITGLLDFFLHGRLLKQVNATLLALILKVQLPATVADFRPISRCNVLYKAIIKIMVQRLRPLLNRLISPTKNAFIPGQSISDNIFLAQELFAGYNKQQLPPRGAMKVDLRKAYDSEMRFFVGHLQLFDFPSLFINWVEECVTTSSFSVCLNGSIHGFFPGTRGLRQKRSYVSLSIRPHYGGSCLKNFMHFEYLKSSNIYTIITKNILPY
ncbi:UNVERIFIED_CONTAM: hypothetical protein Slati_4266400 [Sesamum latifolium]|uniref:Reverse transcriptase domain-containing protein n=1 Tax=Sesamum latifolium TaxID=2727402 RepID=A0AAW2TC85_9LAMI